LKGHNDFLTDINDHSEVIEHQEPITQFNNLQEPFMKQM